MAAGIVIFPFRVPLIGNLFHDSLIIEMLILQVGFKNGIDLNQFVVIHDVSDKA